MALFPDFGSEPCDIIQASRLDQLDSTSDEGIAAKSAAYKNQVYNGLNEIIKVSFQPESRIANVVAKGKNNITDTILAKQGGSRVMNTVLGGTNDAARQSVDAASGSILSALSLGTLDQENLDDHAKTYIDAAVLIDAAGNQTIVEQRHECGPMPYSVDLDTMGVKQKFLFAVEFEFSEQFKTSLGSLDFPFMVKACERPSVVFDYEDINLYSYRTKVVKRTQYNPLTMRFNEDGLSQVTSFYQQYLKAMSPIANVSAPHLFETDGQETGMSYNYDNNHLKVAPGTAGQGDAPVWHYGASVGPLNDEIANLELGTKQQHINDRHVLQSIKIYHIYRNRRHDHGTRMDVYKLLNPRITEMHLDELNMEESEKTEASFTFDFDSVFTMTNVPAETGVPDYASNLAHISSLGRNGLQNKYRLNTSNNYDDGIYDDFTPERPQSGFLSKVLGPFQNTAAGQILNGVTQGGISGIVEDAQGLKSKVTASATGLIKGQTPSFNDFKKAAGVPGLSADDTKAAKLNFRPGN